MELHFNTTKTKESHVCNFQNSQSKLYTLFGNTCICSKNIKLGGNDLHQHHASDVISERRERNE